MREATPLSPSPSPPRAGGGAQTHSFLPPEIIRSDLESRTRHVADALFELARAAANVQAGAERDVGEKANATVSMLAQLDAIKDRIQMMVPKDVLDHTRSFVNRLASENQYSVGQHESIRRFRDDFGHALQDAFPELTDSIAAATVGTEPMEKPTAAKIAQAGDAQEAPPNPSNGMDVDTQAS
ncbi:hypothetical protein MCUN1_002402 [Malassezia cuniculi]|uniref:Mediator of RNA polymerase II transcription subunit 10 n=1 Tax=Malassezia cuniculi TaxID=948313 RepID=A0AAF0EWD1_9BASI|nr:hypothetical protein MCUN1_002402 [Malassezia cuniculi]